MKNNALSRRNWMLSAAALPVAGSTMAGARNIVIASDNGQRACARAMDLLRAGGDTLDAVVTGVNINEEDPEDSSVGYGGLPNEEGTVELDASVMHGPTRRAGSVASIRNIKTPSKVAKIVMEHTDHIMLVGDNALRFAKAWGFQEEDLLTDRSRRAWLLWKQSLRDGRDHNNWTDGLDAPVVEKKARVLFPEANQATLAWAVETVLRPPTGTISCLALKANGEMSGVTTTSGLAWKIPGRVGDSPIIGAGLYVDQDVGAAGSTGRGEENIRVAGAHSIVEIMRQGKDPREACLETLRRVARNYGNDISRLSRFDLNFYALRKDGAYAGASLWHAGVRQGQLVRRRFAVNDGAESRLEDCAYLFERKQ